MTHSKHIICDQYQIIEHENKIYEQLVYMMKCNVKLKIKIKIAHIWDHSCNRHLLTFLFSPKMRFNVFYFPNFFNI